MRGFVASLREGDAGNKDEAIVQALCGMAQLTGNDAASALAISKIIDSFSENLEGIHTMTDCEYRAVSPIPSNKVEVQKVVDVPSVPYPPIKESPAKDPSRASRLSVYAEKFKSNNIESVPTPSFQTALAAAGIKKKEEPAPEEDERLKAIDKRMIEMIENEVLMSTTGTKWEDVAGLEDAKQAVKEAAILPMIYPELFQDLREPPKGILFFGPPGTGKTMIAKALATEAKCTFFNISAASLTSKWVGEGEKLTRALFAVARVKSPSIVFIDEIDSLLTKRSDSDFEASRRVKTEFLLQFEGVASGNERVLVLGATNRPQDLDDAARRRFTRRIYIPLPDPETRRALILLLLRRAPNTVTEDQVNETVDMTEGYSCADISSLFREAAMIPLRCLHLPINPTERPTVRPLSFEDITMALQRVRPSVSQDSIEDYIKWNSEFGYSS